MESQKKQLGIGTGIPLNCKECLEDRHDSCLNNGCLCAIETNHNAPTKEAELIQEFTSKAKQVMPTREEYRELNKEYELEKKRIFQIGKNKKNFQIKIRKEPIQEGPRKEKWFQCTHCDYQSQSFKAFEQCKKKRHEIITVYVPVEDSSKLSKSNDLIDKTSDLIQKKMELVTNRQNKEILMYDGKIYRKDTATKSIIEEEVEKIIDNCTTHERNEVINKLKARTGKDLDEFDKDYNVISLENGILDIETLTKKDHTPKHLSTVLVSVEYNEPKHKIHDETIFEDIENNLKDTLFWKFLKSSFTVNEEFQRESFESILEITASFFIKKQIDEKAFMFLGRGENGKSVLTEYIINLLGSDNVEKISLQALSEDKFMSAKLVGKMANIFSDLNDSSLNDTGVIKNITSMEGIEAQHKHGHPFVLQPFCKLLFSCNRFPKVQNDQTQGFFRRWMIIKWQRNFENDPEKDEHLKDKLKENQEEKNLVFSCLIHLTRLLMKKGKFTYSKNWKETQEEWNANADPLNDFVETCIVDSDGNRGVRETYKFYRQMMISRQETPLSIAKFGSAFKEYFDHQVTKEGGKSERVWLNIDFIIPTVNDYNSK